MHLPGNIRVTRTLRRLRSRLRPGIAILGYHRVANGREDPLALSVSPQHFAAQLDVIVRLGQLMRLDDAAAAIAAGRTPRCGIVLTFDDGYADNLHTVLPLLEERGIPATMFVTSGNRGGEFWWDRLARLSRCVAMHGQAYDVAASLEVLSDAERESRLAEIERAAGAVSAPVHRALTEVELRRLASSPLVEIGAHTVSHQPLPRLPIAQQREEIHRSRDTLERSIGRPVTCFAYPHGAVTSETVAIVEEAGYAVACCSKFDVAARFAPPLALPRLWVSDWDGSSFERWLRGWLHG